MAKSYKLAMLGGDGTGPEVAREAKKVMEVAARKYGFKLDFTEFDTVPTQLDLAILAADEFQRAISPPPGEIPGPVNALAPSRRQVEFHELLRREIFPIEVSPRHSVSTDAEFPGDADRRGQPRRL